MNLMILNPPLRGFKTLLVGGRRSAVLCNGTWNVIPEWGTPFTVPVHWSLDDPTLAFEPAINRLAAITFVHGDTSVICNMVAQFDDEADCYMWSAESFGFAQWRKQEWKLGSGRIMSGLNWSTRPAAGHPSSSSSSAATAWNAWGSWIRSGARRLALKSPNESQQARVPSHCHRPFKPKVTIDSARIDN